MHKIFEAFRNFGLLDQQENFFKFTAYEHLVTSGFCNHLNPPIIGKAVSCIIDGNKSTAYAENVENDFAHEQQITIQFLHSPIFVNTLFYTTLCGPPKDLLIQGSNDNKSWETLAKQDSPLKSNSENAIQCHKKKHFSFIKMSQTMNSADYYRMHIQELEIYGTFGDIPLCSIHSRICRNYLLFIIFLFES